MTTKLKIISGFGLILLVLAVVAAFGVVQMRGATDSFSLYRRHARVNVLSSDMSSAASDVLRYLNAFLNDRDPELIDNALASLDVVAKRVRELRDTSRIEERLRLIEAMGRRGEEIRPQLVSTRDDVLNIAKLFDGQVLPAFASMYKLLGELSNYARDIAGAEELYQITEVWFGMSRTLTALTRFSQTLNKEDAARSIERLAELRGRLGQLRASLSLEKSKTKFGQIMESFELVLRNAQAMQEGAAKKDASVEQVRDNANALNKTVVDFSADVDKDTREVAESIIKALADAELVLLGSSGTGLAVGVLLAIAIIFGLMRVLRKLTAYAEALAGGDFSSPVRISEKGEIGQVYSAMRSIASVLGDILETYRMLAGDIQYGKLLSQADPARFRGSFSTLIEGTNNIVGNLRGIIDKIPSPVLMMNKETRVEYLNLRAAEVAGADGVGKTCRQLFNREDSDTPADALRRAIDTRRPATAETRCKPRGKEMDISYSALPLLDKEGAVTVVLQLITDLTSIKNTERVIMQAANQASNISGRVAAASEELSAQIEQVSRGAETQRARVESTASAMTEMNSTVLEVARSAGQASEQSGLTRDKAQSGARLVNQVVNSINHINSVATTLQNNMQELGVQVESIGGVMNVISDIADQTNLLALNAAIEAARAGEAGRGFAVVADEVRKLAEKTISATQEVGSNINAIQQSAKSNIQEVGSAVRSIGEATDLANSSGKELTEIVDMAEANSAIVASIATAAEEQSATSEEINRAVEEIHKIINETTDGMVQSSAAVHELSQMAQELNRVMEGLQKQ